MQGGMSVFLEYLEPLTYQEATFILILNSKPTSANNDTFTYMIEEGGNLRL